jgi:predicted enzyme related to lactoylglutathione lyase
MSKAKTAPSSNIIWFEIPADEPKRAQTFYKKMFGWKINVMPGMTDYWHLDTGGDNASPDAGMLPRKHASQPITNYFNVPSLTRAVAKLQKLGGTVCMGRTAVPQRGYFAICRDTENNEFALWENNLKAK